MKGQDTYKKVKVIEFPNMIARVYIPDLTEEERKSGMHFKFNVASILRGDLKTQADCLSKYVNNGIYTPNEARDMLDFTTKEGGDVLMVNGNYIPITQVGSQYQKGGD